MLKDVSPTWLLSQQSLLCLDYHNRMDAAQGHDAFFIRHNTGQAHMDVNVIKSIKNNIPIFPRLFFHDSEIFKNPRPSPCIPTEFNFVGFSHCPKMLISFRNLILMHNIFSVSYCMYHLKILWLCVRYSHPTDWESLRAGPSHWKRTFDTL